MVSLNSHKNTKSYALYREKKKIVKIASRSIIWDLTQSGKSDGKFFGINAGWRGCIVFLWDN